MAFVETLSPFFADFAVSATVGGQAVQGIFDNGYQLGSVGAVGLSATQPTLTVATASLPADPVGAAAVVGGVAYVVAEHQPDGTGVSTLLLERSA